MIDINVTVSSPDIVQAIGLLVNAIQHGAPAPIQAAEPTWMKETSPTAAQPAPIQPAPIVSPAPIQPVPIVPPAPIQPVPVQAPTAPAPTFTTAQVAKAGADLMSGNPSLQPTLVELIHKYGAQTVQDISQDKLGAFATELRQMGAKI